MKKSFRLLALTMLMLMLRYTLMPHQFMAYAHCEQVLAVSNKSSDMRIDTAPIHRDMEQVYVVEHPEQYLLNQFLVSDYLPPHTLASVPLGIADPVLRPWLTATLPQRGPPWPANVSEHIASTHLLI